MTTVTVYDPPMCCSTGVCGPEIDPKLAQFAGNLDWLKSRGVEALRRFAAGAPERTVEDAARTHRKPREDLPALGGIVDDIERPGKGLVMFMGKGGVGKTTLAIAVATELAARGHEVLLTTTDPAAHLVETLGGEVPDLTVSRIDPAKETARYRDHVMATKGKDLDAAARAMLEEDLRRAGIEPWGWIVNSSLAATRTTHPLLRLRAEAEREQIAKVREELTTRHAVVPMRAEEPGGASRLQYLLSLPETVEAA